MWEKTCVPADKCKTNKPCPNWLGLGQSTPVKTECQRQRESALGLGGFAPSCDINGDFDPLQCGAGFCWCVYADGTEIPNTKCETASSSLTDAECALLRNEAPYQGVKPLQCGAGFCWCVNADGTKIPGTKFAMALSALTDSKCALYREKVPTPVDTPVVVGVTKRQCACKMALKLSTSG